MTNYLDALLGNPQKKLLKKYFPMHLDFMGEYPDVASFLFLISIASNYDYYTNLHLESKNNNLKCVKR